MPPGAGALQTVTNWLSGADTCKSPTNDQRVSVSLSGRTGVGVYMDFHSKCQADRQDMVVIGRKTGYFS